MRHVVAFISPDRFDHLVEELAEHSIYVSGPRGFGQEHDPAHPEHLPHPAVDLVEKLRLDALRLKSGERGEGALGPTSLGRHE